MAELFDVNDIASPGYYAPSQTALLLLDFHSMFIEKVAGSNGPSAMQTAAKLRRWAKQTGISVVHARIDTESPAIRTAKQYPRLSGIGQTMRSSGGDAEPAELLADVAGEEDWSFTRPPGYISALSSPGIMQVLREKGIKSLVLCGLSTSGCVLRTAVDACEKESVVTVILDGCADSDAEVHRVVTAKVLQMTAFVCTADEFVAGFEAKK